MVLILITVLLEGISNTTVTTDAEAAVSKATEVPEPVIPDFTPATPLTIEDLEKLM